MRRARVAGVVALTLVAGYVILFFVAFFGGPEIVAPYLPKPPAVPHAEKPVQNDAPSSKPRPPAGGGAQAGTTVPGTGTVPVGQAVQGIPAPPAVPGATAAPASKAPAPETSNSTGQVNNVATPAPAAQGTGQQAPTEPGKSGTAPGQTTRPTPPPHP